jgi:hypothetical protein
VHASTLIPGWAVPQSSAEIEALLDSRGMPSCACCGAITDGVDPVCYRWRSGNRSTPPYGARRAIVLGAQPVRDAAMPSARPEAPGTSAPDSVIAPRLIVHVWRLRTWACSCRLSIGPGTS